MAERQEPGRGPDEGPGAGPGTGRLAAIETLRVTGQEARRRNAGAVAMDVLYLFTTAFLATLAVRGFWPAIIAALPLATFLYFAWRSSWPFFLANLAAVGLAVAATETGAMPL